MNAVVIRLTYLCPYIDGIRCGPVDLQLGLAILGDLSNKGHSMAYVVPPFIAHLVHFVQSTAVNNKKKNNNKKLRFTVKSKNELNIIELRHHITQAGRLEIGACESRIVGCESLIRCQRSREQRLEVREPEIANKKLVFANQGSAIPCGNLESGYRDYCFSLTSCVNLC